MTHKARIHPGDGDPRHGTMNGYNNLRCRCQDCRDAWAAYTREAKERRLDRPVPANAHGKYTTYSNWFCRCDPCVEAWNEYCRQVSARRRKTTV